MFDLVVNPEDWFSCVEAHPVVELDAAFKPDTLSISLGML